MAKLKSEIEVVCPCCQATLVIDVNLGRVISHQVPERGDKPELTEAARILAAEREVKPSRLLAELPDLVDLLETVTPPAVPGAARRSAAAPPA